MPNPSHRALTDPDMKRTRALNIIALVAVFVLAAALVRPAGPVTINARDITIRQDARVNLE